MNPETNEPLEEAPVPETQEAAEPAPETAEEAASQPTAEELLRQELENIREVQAATPVDEVRLAALLARYDALSGLKKQLAETLGERVFR